jgi:hypothetical protein
MPVTNALPASSTATPFAIWSLPVRYVLYVAPPVAVRRVAKPVNPGLVLVVSSAPVVTEKSRDEVMPTTNASPDGVTATSVA